LLSDRTFVERPAKGSLTGVEHERRRDQGTAPAVAMRVLENDGKAPRVELTMQIHRFSARVRTRIAVLDVVELRAPRSRRRPRARCMPSPQCTRFAA
jgi:hypothetical protein